MDVTFDDLGFISGDGSCPAGYHFDAMGETFEIPFDIMCDFAGYLSFIIMGLAYYRAGVIVIQSWS